MKRTINQIIDFVCDSPNGGPKQGNPDLGENDQNSIVSGEGRSILEELGENQSSNKKLSFSRMKNFDSSAKQQSFTDKRRRLTIVHNQSAVFGAGPTDHKR